MGAGELIQCTSVNFVSKSVINYLLKDKEHKINVTNKYLWLRQANLTIHFSVGLPFVVPASERLTVVLSTLLRSEVHRRNGARPSVTQLVETAGAWTKFTIVLRSIDMTGEEKHKEKTFKTLI